MRSPASWHSPARRETVGLGVFAAVSVTMLWVLPYEALDGWSMLVVAGVGVFGIVAWRRQRTSGWLTLLVVGMIGLALLSSTLLELGLEQASSAIDCLPPLAAMAIIARVYGLRWRDRGLMLDMFTASAIALLTFWTLLVVPSAERTADTVSLVWMSLSSALWVLVAVATAIAIGHRRQPSAVVGLSVTCVMLGEIGYLGDLGGLWSVSERVLLTPYVVAYALAAGFFLPSISRRLLRPPPLHGHSSRWRMRGVLGAGLLAIAFVLVGLHPPASVADSVVRVVSGVLIAVALTLRVTGLALRDSADARRQFVDMTRDAATGRLNRLGLVQQWEQRSPLRVASPVCALAIEIEQLEDHDLLYGSSVRDALVQVAAGRVASACDPDDLVGVQGDGTTLVIAARDRPQADLLAARILAAMAAPVQVAAGRFPLRCSVGYALATGGTNRQRLDVLLRSALRAAHQAGAALGGACAVCADDMPGSVRTDQQQLTEQMVAAVGAGRIEVVHRPLTELDGGALVGLTSVAMWLDPAGERHMTVGGFPQRARMDLLAQQLLHSLEFVARGRYDARLPETVGVTLSVAAVHLADRSLVDVVDEACRRTGLPPSTFTFEIDEADLLPNEESLATGLEALVERGVQLGVSRFGETRGVSLNRLRGFPVSTVSLSEVLTAGIGQSSNRRFVRAVVAAGRELGFTVWAPLPADTPELRRALAAAGVRWVESGATVHAG